MRQETMSRRRPERGKVEVIRIVKANLLYCLDENRDLNYFNCIISFSVRSLAFWQLVMDVK